MRPHQPFVVLEVDFYSETIEISGVLRQFEVTESLCSVRRSRCFLAGSRALVEMPISFVA